MSPDHPRFATTTKVGTWGGGQDLIKHAKFQLNLFRVIGSMGSIFAISYTQRCGLYNRFGLTLNLWYIFLATLGRL